jgi:D-alanine-D-alanine ligase
MRVVVLGGGTSSEALVSARSANTVLSAVGALGYDAVYFDPKTQKNLLELIDKEDIVLPILHGSGGEDGTIQKMLSDVPVRYLGSGAQASANCFDKAKTRDILIKHSIPVARGDVINRESYQTHELRKTPHILKWVTGGSSIGTFKVLDPGDVTETFIDEVFSAPKVLIEELIVGTECTAGILGEGALPIVEIIPPASGFDYENKYNGKTQELCPPKNISKNLQKNIQAIARNVHDILGCRHLSRVDFMIDADGQPFVLEVNTMPGMTDQSLFPEAANAAGITFEQLVQQFIEMTAKG